MRDLLVALVLAGLGAALAASGLTLLLHGIAHLATGGGESYADLPVWRRVLTPVVGSGLAGFGWWVLRAHGPVVSLDAVRADPSRRMGLRRNTADAVITVVAVGSGMAIGRETAPRQVAAALADHLTTRLPDEDRVLVMAAASAAGLAAVYNAPLAGIAYCAEVLVRRWSWRAGWLAAVTCGIATVAAWPVIGWGPNLGAFPGGGPQWWAGLPLGLVAAGLGLAYRRLTEWGRDHENPRGPMLVAGLAGVGLALGVATIWLPALTGNGRAAIGAVLAGPGLIGAAGLLAVKPLLTTAFLRAGAVGGVLAPALAAGACAGAVVGYGIGAPDAVPGLAVATAGATLSVTQRAPLFGPLLAWEMTHPNLATTVALGLATVVAQVALRLGARVSTR